MTKGTEKRDQLIQMIEQGLAGIRREIAKEMSGVRALDELYRLRFIERSLIEMKHILDREDWRSYPKSEPGIGNVVVDSWPLDDLLSKLLVRIEYDYGRLK